MPPSRIRPNHNTGDNIPYDRFYIHINQTKINHHTPCLFWNDEIFKPNLETKPLLFSLLVSWLHCFFMNVVSLCSGDPYGYSFFWIPKHNHRYVNLTAGKYHDVIAGTVELTENKQHPGHDKEKWTLCS